MLVVAIVWLRLRPGDLAALLAKNIIKGDLCYIITESLDDFRFRTRWNTILFYLIFVFISVYKYILFYTETHAKQRLNMRYKCDKRIVVIRPCKSMIKFNEVSFIPLLFLLIITQMFILHYRYILYSRIISTVGLSAVPKSAWIDARRIYDTVRP